MFKKDNTKEKVDRSAYTRLKEDKNQRINFTSSSNPVNTENSKNSQKNDLKSFSIKTFVPEKEN